jgi:4-amino-4-deoxy-L-arabinose transferase-like glycosyltransferase
LEDDKHLIDLAIIKNTRFHIFLVIFFGSLLTALNLYKPFHIDDTFYLEVAKWIHSSPFRPMSGTVNWSNDSTPFFLHNNPPLFPYLIAAVSYFFGFNEVAIHLLVAVFCFLAIYYFYKICIQLNIQNIPVLLFLFAFSPAFVVNQNTMTDVPLVSILLASFLYLLKRNYLISLFLFSIGMLIKYSILPFFVVVLIVILLRENRQKLFYSLIPIIIIGLWCWWNFLEYGSVHILDRPKSLFEPIRVFDFLACLGSISFFSISIIYCFIPKKGVKILILSIAVSIILGFILFVNNTFSESEITPFLNQVFLINGILIAISILTIVVFKIKNEDKTHLYIMSNQFLVVLTIAFFSVFIIGFAPFMATRHLLLIIPFILILADQYLFCSSKLVNIICFAGTFCLALLLGISDFKYAQYYKLMANEVKLPDDVQCFTAGHWGWQWYSTKKGMKVFSTNQSGIQTGDILIYPGNVHLQRKNQNLKLQLIEKRWKESDCYTYFAVSNYASMYYSSTSRPTWYLSKRPIDTIFVKKASIE